MAVPRRTHVRTHPGVHLLVRHWWNRRYGRLVRRDVLIWSDGYRGWEVEARKGGGEGTSRRQAVHDEREASVLAQRWREAGGDDWLDVTPKREDRPGVPPG
jgi:hypothetical protein